MWRFQRPINCAVSLFGTHFQANPVLSFLKSIWERPLYPIQFCSSSKRCYSQAPNTISTFFIEYHVCIPLRLSTKVLWVSRWRIDKWMRKATQKCGAFRNIHITGRCTTNINHVLHCHDFTSSSYTSSSTRCEYISWQSVFCQEKRGLELCRTWYFAYTILPHHYLREFWV